jgi:hypothetical protein
VRAEVTPRGRTMSITHAAPASWFARCRRPAAADPRRALMLARLARMLARDEQVRSRLLVTLPGRPVADVSEQRFSR